MNIPENLDRWMFDYMEGNLSPHEVKELEQFLLDNPNFDTEAEAWNNAVIADQPVAYPNQQHLERNNKIVGWYNWSAAAVLLLLVGIGGYFATQSNNPSSESTLTTTTNYTQHYKSNNTIYGSSMNNTSLVSLHENKQTQVNQLSQLNSNQILNNDSQLRINLATLSLNESTSFTSGEAAIASITDRNGENFQLNNVTENNNRVLYNEGTAQGDENTVSNFNGASVRVSAALKQTKEKFHSDEYTSKYQGNPSEGTTDIDLSKKNNININSFGNRTKRIYRKIEKMFMYPVALVNLRDPELLLPEKSLLGFNPAFAGGMLAPRLEMFYRNQWLGTELGGQRVQVSYDNYVSNLRGGVGVTFNSTILGGGAFGDQSISVSYSPKISLSKNIVFEPAINATLGILTGNTSKFKGVQSFEVERGMLLQNTFTSEINRIDKLWYKDYGVGAMLNTKWFYVGASADNLSGHYGHVYRTEGNVEPIRTPVEYNTIIGVDYESVNKNLSLSPFLAARKFGEFTEAWAGVSFRFNHFTLGASYSTNKAYTAAMGMKFKQFKLVYQFDNTHSLLSTEAVGAHSIGIRFTGELKNPRFK